MKKKILAIMMCILLTATLSGCAAGKSSTTATAKAYQSVAVATGDVMQAVSGTGVLTFVDAVKQKATAEVKVNTVSVKAGDTVQKGDKLAEYDAAVLSTNIAKLYTNVQELRQKKQSALNTYQSEVLVRAGVQGRIKAVYMTKGDMAATVAAAKGGLVLISTDGLMTVQIPGKGLSLHTEVSVKADKDSYTGYVSKLDGDTATISFPDTKVLPDGSVDVYLNKVLLGSGKAQIDLPYLLPADDGVITDVNVEVNDTVNRGTTVAHAQYLAMDDTYAALVDGLAQAQADLEAARALKAQGAILATEGGVVASVVPEGMYPIGTTIAEIYPQGQFEFVTTVDELDIFSIAVGQQATIQFDGIPAKQFVATVSKISSIGQVINGFTTYAVTLAVTDDGTLKSDLNGTATLIVNQRKGVLTLPVEAVQNDSQGEYVTTADAAQQRIAVQTGISDGQVIEITAGLSAGDRVMLRMASDIATLPQE